MEDDARARYFKELRHDLDRGGREAMLYDLLGWDLGNWHPRQARRNGTFFHERRSLRRVNSLLGAIHGRLVSP
jgi:hypothetical protein